MVYGQRLDQPDEAFLRRLELVGQARRAGRFRFGHGFNLSGGLRGANPVGKSSADLPFGLTINKT